MIIIIALLLLGSLLPHLSFSASVNVGIVNGREARPHSRPYMVSIQENGFHICGGFLISDQFVLTAAHCRESNEILTVVAGAHDLRNRQNFRIEVRSYMKHPSYKPVPDLQGDIMILKLNERVRLNENIKKILIPKRPLRIEAGSVCSVAGWGDLVTNGAGSPKLMEAGVRIMSKPDCARRWSWVYKPSQMICVYGYGGSCMGDSGGPLVCGGTAMGVTSFGNRYNCNDAVLPNAYTEISAFLPWIKNVIRRAN